MNAVAVYATYLWQTFLPFHLAVYYPHPGEHIAWGTVGACAALLIGVSAVTVVRVRRNPYLLVGWAWYLGTLVPMIGIVQVGSQQMADRYTYFPLIGVFLALVWLIAELASGRAFSSMGPPVDHSRVPDRSRLGCLRSSRLLAGQHHPISPRSCVGPE